MPRVIPIQFRRGTSAAWELAHASMLAGEPGFDTTLGLMKVGDGILGWDDLPFLGCPVPFTFTAAVDVTMGEVSTSDPETITGGDGQTWPLTIRGDGSPQLKIGSGSWGTDGIAINGDEVTVRLTASEDPATETVATLYGPGITVPYSVTTETIPEPPSGSAFWMKPDTGLPASVSDPVSTWVDQSGNGRDFVQASGTLQPLRAALGILPDGSNDYMAITGYAPTTDLTLWWVLDTSGSAPGVLRCLFGTGQPQWFVLFDPAGPTWSFGLGHATVSTNRAWNTVSRIVMIRDTGTNNISVYLNGVDSGLSGVVNMFAPGDFALFYRGIGGELWADNVKSCGGYESVLPAPDLAVLESYQQYVESL